MNIDHCREFIVLAQCLNFTEAALTLNITQPALSKHILSLEKEFGIIFFDRSRKGIQLTEAGRVFFESAGSIIGTYDETRGDLDVIKSRKPLHIVGHLEDSDIAPLASMIAMIAREKYHASLVFDRVVASDPFKQLVDNSVDLFLGYTDPLEAHEKGLCCKPFLVNRLTIIVNNSHPLAERTSVTWEELLNETFIEFISDKTSPAWGQIERTCQSHGFTPKTRTVSSQNEVEFFSTPLQGSILVWKKTQKQIGMMLETGHRASVPLSSEDAFLVVYAVYTPANEDRLNVFFSATEEAKALLDNRKARKDNPS